MKNTDSTIEMLCNHVLDTNMPIQTILEFDDGEKVRIVILPESVEKARELGLTTEIELREL